MEKWLGQTPVKLKTMKEEDFESYFIYIYGYFWDYKNNNNSGSLLELLHEIKEEVMLLGNDIERRWWANILLLCRKLCKDKKYYFLLDYIDIIVNEFEYWSLKEIEVHVNNVNFLLTRNSFSTLCVRPFEIENICIENPDMKNCFKHLFLLKNDVVQLFRKHINEKDIKIEKLGYHYKYDLDKTIKYSDLINQYAEGFLGYMHSYIRTTFSSSEVSKKIFLEEDKEIIVANIKYFFDTSYNKTNTHDLIDSIANIVLKKYSGEGVITR